ncbi:MAG: phage tail sheath protein FI [Rickettsiales bacterium]|jgi:phage tail sheath protein FI
MSEQFLHGVEVIELNDGARPIKTAKSSVIGLIGTAPKGPVNQPILILGSRKEAVAIFGENTKANEGFTIPKALDGIFDQVGAVVVVINVADSANPAHLTDGALDAAKIDIADVVGGIDGVTGQYKGVQVLLAANTELAVTPRILIAPGFTNQAVGNTANAVVAELIGIAESLRAIIVADLPSGETDLISDAISYVANFGSARIYPVFPFVKVLNSEGEIVDEPASARVAGLIAKSDAERGFWWSPSNLVINGIVGISKPIDFALGDPNSKANYLNENNIATIIQESGFRLWGNRTLSADPKWSFLQARRTADMINDSLLKAHLWAVDRNICKTYIEDVLEGVNNYLRHLKSIGAIIGGNAYIDPELNTPSQIAQGKITFDFDFTPPYPAEHITFRSRMTDDYLAELV